MINLRLNRRAVGGNPADQAVAKKTAGEAVPVQIGERVRSGKSVVAAERLVAVDERGVGRQLVVGQHARQIGHAHIGHAAAIAEKAAVECAIKRAVETSRKEIAGIGQRHGIDITGKGAGRQRACQLRRRQGAGKVARGIRENRIRRRRQQLARAEDGEGAGAAIGAHADGQPAGRTGENTRTKIQRNREQAVADGGGGIGDRPGDDIPRQVGRIVNRKLQIVTAIGSSTVILKLALIGERRALGEKRFNRGKCQNNAEQDKGRFGFHNNAILDDGWNNSTLNF